MRTVNILEYNDALLTRDPTGKIVPIESYVTNWESLNSTLAITGENFVVDSRYVIELYPSSASSITLILEDVPLTIKDNNRVLSANIKMRANSSFNVEASLFLDGDDSEITPHVQSFNSGQYNAVQTNRVVVPDDESIHSVTIRFVITTVSVTQIYATLPHLIHDLQMYGNRFIAQMRNFFPDFYWEIDSEAEYPTHPFFRFVDVLTAAASETRDAHDDFYVVEKSELSKPESQIKYWTHSRLVSPSGVRDDYAPWLNQFTGSRLYRNLQYGDGNLYFNNPSITRDFLEWQLRTSSFGRNAGTRQAMIEAAKQVLIRTKNGNQSTLGVAITPRYNGDPFALRVQTLTNETIDAEEGESSELILHVMSLVKPLGYKVFHITVDEFFFTLDDPSIGRLDFFRWG
jgi:hypothetical protein